VSVKAYDKVFDKHRGMNDLSSLKRIKDDELNEIINFKYIPAAENKVELHMREGTVKDTMTTALTGATAVGGIVNSDYTGGNETLFHHDEFLYVLDTTPLKVMSGVTDAIHSFAMLEDNVIIANGTDVLLEKAYGTVPTAVGDTPPVAKYLHTWHNFVWAAGVTTALSTIYHCKLNDKDIWTDTGSGNQTLQHGTITGIHGLFDNLYAFFERNITKITGYAAGAFVYSDYATIGCISHYGIVSDGTTLYWPAHDGFYALGALGATDKVVGGISLIKLSQEKLRTFWDTLDTSTIGIIRGVNDPANHCVRWSVRRTGQSVNDREVVFDYHEHVMGFYITEGRSPNCYALGKDTIGNWQVKYGNADTGMVYKLDPDTTDDDGTAIAGSFKTKAYDFQRPDLDKKWNTVDVLAKSDQSQTVTTMHYGVGDFPDYDNEKEITTQNLIQYDTGLQYDDGNYYTEGTFRNYKIAIRKFGKSLALKFVCNILDKLVQIAGWTINAQVFNKKVKSDV